MNRLAKPRLVAALLVSAAAAAALVPAEAAQSSRGEVARVRCSSTVNVKMGDSNSGSKLFFSKRRVTIRPGACVRWIWTGVLPHQVGGPGFRSKERSAPFRFRKRFAKARSRAATIICTVHPSMRMKVAVHR
jgi:plastocyanin